MKPAIYLIVPFLMLQFQLSAQSTLTEKYISVTGSAEVIVKPDEIDLEIVLQEYDEPGIGPTIELAKLEKKLFDALAENNIPAEKVLFNNSNYYWYYWWRHRMDHYKTKTFTVKLDKETNFLELMKDLDFKGVSSVTIAKTTNHQIQELRKEVKIQAVKAAKEKARYLLESIDEKLGGLISIEEMPENNYYRQPQTSNMQITTQNTGDEIENITSIKLRFEIKATFAIE